MHIATPMIDAGIGLEWNATRESAEEIKNRTANDNRSATDTLNTPAMTGKTMSAEAQIIVATQPGR
jgi:hypothetical protein